MGVYSEQHLEIQRSVRKLIETEINPYVDEWEARCHYPAHEIMKKLGDLGMLGITKPELFGGLGLDYSYALAFAETLGEIHCLGVPTSIGVQTDMATPALARYGSDELRREFLSPAISGDMVACIGVSEPGAGSDVSQITTVAYQNGDDYVINGTKMWITNGAQADWMCMLANTNEGDAHNSKSLIIVPLNIKGVSVSHKLDKMGLRSSDTAQLHFDDVRVPRRHLIGQEGLGFRYQMEQFQEERLCVAASSLRPMEKAIDDAQAYATERKVQGRRIIDNQVVRFKLAELRTEVELLRSLIHRAVEDYISGREVVLLASMAKLTSGRLIRKVSDSCLQYFGGMGFMSETPISRLYRDCRVLSIGGGADEIMLEIISKRCGMTGHKEP
ncbi:acyl-CoA dehydrogenase family protein [Kineobactrum salinum]|uniref:Acyl-CoA dehydrogenase n=1 Tax=Kineobactrum salinum TaxID=2708301 RepID=A0A6C0UC98_9GAMM|nr:acyl-CoA dehydrogenase family protein [Kineobactrum salinum]QIB67744.1 acyl-CoA dehydrogenase [Kineobactrum salinum]